MKYFADFPRPLIVGSVRQRNPDAAIAEIQAEEADGARAFIIHIQLLEEKYKTYGEFKKIAEATEHPIMAINYRTDGVCDDEQRIEVMFEAVRAGFRSVDIPVYMYDEDPRSSLHLSNAPFIAGNPNEISMRPEIILKQKELLKEFQAMGAEVLVSAHVGGEFNAEQIVSLGLEVQSRGADIVKIITLCGSKEHQLEILRGNLALQNALDIPFLYTCSGKYNRFIRFNAPLYGSMLVFGHHEYGELSNKEKPLINDLKKFYEFNF